MIIEYVLILILQALGIYFNVMENVVKLGDKYPAETPKSIFRIFWHEDWDTLATSAGIILLNLVGHYIVFEKLHMTLLPEWYWQLAPYFLSLLGGYAGQRLIYKVFGTAEKCLEKRADDLLK